MRRYLIVVSMVLALMLGACSQGMYSQGKKHLARGEYDAAIEALYKELNTNPQNADAWRELGVAYYESKQLDKAEDALQQANSIQPSARGQLYQGLIHEKRDRVAEAIQAYTTSLSLQSGGKTARLVRGHLDQLVAKKLEQEAEAAVAGESGINVDTIPKHTLVVAGFDGSNLPDEIAPLARGITALTSQDLAKVNSLTVLDRMKLDLIMKELELGQSGYVDPTTAPRVGKLMGSGRIVTGTALSLGDDGLKLDGVLVNTFDSSSSRTRSIEGKLEDFFQIQKDFVFSLIENMGITLSQAERDAIEEVPTESYVAFLAYCRGLEYQSRGQHGEAKQEFITAQEADKGFGLADIEIAAAEMGELGYTESFAQLEGAVQQFGDLPRPDFGNLGGSLSNILANTGFTPPPGQGGAPVLNPPATAATVRVIIRGNLDAF